jgi:hypothetical protein
MATLTAPKASTEELTVVPGKTGSGRPIFSTLVKRTYDIRAGQAAVRAEKTIPLVKVDIYYDHGDPETCCVKYETDLVPYKLATDVVAIARAYGPAAKPVTEMAVAIEIDGHAKLLRVIGDRRCIFRAGYPPIFTEPMEFTEMELRYERAYGGTDTRANPAMPFSYPRNPLGMGMVLKNTRESIDGLPLPNLEDPADLLIPERVVLGELEMWNQQPLPQGFGWFQRTWYPRCSFVGSVPGFVDPDEVMREEMLGLVPKGQLALARQFKLPSFDVRFNNGASLGLTFPYLTGAERVRLTNLTPDGQLEFYLPDDAPQIMMDIGLGENEVPPVLQTLSIRPDEMQIDLVWRGSHEYPGVEWLPEMKKMVTVVT